jgi:D-lactate dehydrogenase
MKPGAMLINTGRGALVNTKDALQALKSGQLGYLGIDVYEHEHDLFYEDQSGTGGATRSSRSYCGCPTRW